jgi:hypothetical protein
MASPKDQLHEDEAPVELDSPSGVWKRSPAPTPSRTLHDARNLVFALKATLVWLDELCETEKASVEIREGLNGLLTEALSSGTGTRR